MAGRYTHFEVDRSSYGAIQKSFRASLGDFDYTIAKPRIERQLISRMSKGRLEAFSDGVIAVIITIMVLDLRAPLDAKLFLYRLRSKARSDRFAQPRNQAVSHELSG